MLFFLHNNNENNNNNNDNNNEICPIMIKLADFVIIVIVG